MGTAITSLSMDGAILKAAAQIRATSIFNPCTPSTPCSLRPWRLIATRPVTLPAPAIRLRPALPTATRLRRRAHTQQRHLVATHQILAPATTPRQRGQPQRPAHMCAAYRQRRLVTRRTRAQRHQRQPSSTTSLLRRHNLSRRSFAMTGWPLNNAARTQSAACPPAVMASALTLSAMQT